MTSSGVSCPSAGLCRVSTCSFLSEFIVFVLQTKPGRDHSHIRLQQVGSLTTRVHLPIVLIMCVDGDFKNCILQFQSAVSAGLSHVGTVRMIVCCSIKTADVD